MGENLNYIWDCTYLSLNTIALGNHYTLVVVYYS